MVAVKQNKQISMKKGKTIPNEGPSGKMMKGQASNTQKPGFSSQEQSRSKGGAPKGGSTKMFGKTSSKALKPA